MSSYFIWEVKFLMTEKERLDMKKIKNDTDMLK